jgi:hypothetical protein
MIIKYNQLNSIFFNLFWFNNYLNFLFKLDNFFFFFNYRIFNFLIFTNKNFLIFNYFYSYFNLFFKLYFLNNIGFRRIFYCLFYYKYFKSLLYLIFYLKKNNKSILIVDKNNFVFFFKKIEKFVFLKNSENITNKKLFNFYLLKKKVRMIIVLDKFIYDFISLKYPDLNNILLFFPFCNVNKFNKDFLKFFFLNLLYKV